MEAAVSSKIRMASCATLRHESLSLQLVHVVLLCPGVDLSKLVLDRRTCRDKIGLGARVAALVCVFQILDGLERRVGLLGIRRFPASGLESAIVFLAKLLPGAQEDLQGHCQNLHFGQKEALVTLHGPTPARLGGGVAIVCVFAIIVLLLVVRATRVARLAVALVGIVRVSVKMIRGFVCGCPRHPHVLSHLRNRQRGALVVRVVLGT